MKKIILIATLLVGTGALARYEDPRNFAVLSSSLIMKTLEGLKAEQSLICQITTDESGEKTIQYFDEGGRSKFKALFLCDDGSSAIFTGVIGDGGKTATEKFEIVMAE